MHQKKSFLLYQFLIQEISDNLAENTISIRKGWRFIFSRWKTYYLCYCDIEIHISNFEEIVKTKFAIFDQVNLYDIREKTYVPFSYIGRYKSDCCFVGWQHRPSQSRTNWPQKMRRTTLSPWSPAFCRKQ